MAPRVNPMVPNSVGALLAEEWTIDPTSTIPSFLEIAILDAAQHSFWQGLKSTLDLMEERLGMPTYAYGTGWRVQLRRLLLRIRLSLKDLLSRFGPEIRFLLVYALERQCLLSNSSATLMETMNGMRRVKLEQTSTTNSDSRKRRLLPMTKRDGVRLALWTALGPYLLERAGKYRQTLRNSTTNTRFSKIFCYLYPFLYTTAKGLNLLQRWKFLMGESFFIDFPSALLNLVVRRKTIQDASEPNQSTADASPNEATTTTTMTTTNSESDDGLADMKDVLLSLVQSDPIRKTGLSVAAIAFGVSWLARLQAARWTLRRRKSVHHPGMVPHPPPPLPSKVQPCPPTHCALCRQPRVNPTASTSGYVFCLSCLTKFLKVNPVCPVTGKPCPLSSIVRLYEPRLPNSPRSI